MVSLNCAEEVLPDSSSAQNIGPNGRITSIAMNFDVTGLIPEKMRKYRGKQGCYYVDHQGRCVAKTCSSCFEVLPAEAYGVGRYKYNLSNMCRDCSRAYAKSRRGSPSTDGTGTLGAELKRKRMATLAQRTDAQIEADRNRCHPNGTKRCRSCRDSKPIYDFYTHRGLGDGLVETCKQCSHRKRSELKKRPYESHWESIGIPLECYVCGGPYDHSDHVVPPEHGGSDSPENRLPMCEHHNTSKQDTLLEEWLRRKHPELVEDILRKVVDVFFVNPYSQL